VVEIKVDTRNIVVGGARILGLSSNRIQSILSSPIFRPDIPKVQVTSSIQYEEGKTEGPSKTDELLLGVEAGIQIANKIGKVIKDRTKYLKMTIDSQKQPDLYYGCNQLFKNFDGIITFEMYEKLLIYYRNLTAPLRGEVNAA